MRGLKALTQVSLPVVYDEVQLDVGYRTDLLVQVSIVIELKSVKQLHPLHEAKSIAHLKPTDKRLGLFNNFNVIRLIEGLKRFANKL
jgi:GxxExxY protein